jgi:hypothetical protein
MLSASARTFYAAFFAVVLLLGSVQARPADETFDQRKAQQARLSPQTAHDMPACRVAALLQMYDGGWGFVFLMANILTGGITRIPMNERITSPDQCQTPEQVRAEAVPKGKMREAFALFSRDQQAAYIDCYAARKKVRSLPHLLYSLLPISAHIKRHRAHRATPFASSSLYTPFSSPS